MKLSKTKHYDINYLSKVVKIEKFNPHPNPKVERLKCCTVDGFNIICGIDYEPGWYIYFPTSSCINGDFLRFANLYKHSELNADDSKSGMFEDNGRVKAIKLQKVISEGFVLPATVLENYITSITNREFKINEPVEFNMFEDGEKSFWISKKYIPRNNISIAKKKDCNCKKAKTFDYVIPEQFRFHYDTILLKKVPYSIHPMDLIHISSKWHGTSTIHARVLCKQKLNWKQKIAKWLTGEEFNIYDYIYSSRKVIKSVKYSNSKGGGFYDSDVWGEADKIIKPCLQKGITIYAEIVGFLPSGQYIQKNYDYGCIPPNEGETYTYNKHFKIKVYRITLTNVDGLVHEFSTQEVKQYCNSVGLEHVEEFYYGLAQDLYPELDPKSKTWTDDFLIKLSNDTRFYMERNSPDCENKVPHEGIVIKIENGKSEAFKLKCFKFISGEQELLDKGEINIEDEV